MTHLLRLTLVALCIVFCTPALAQINQLNLFTTASKPQDVQVAHAASFVNLNVGVWRDAAVSVADNQRLELTLTMPEGDIVTLDVTRFSVVDAETPLYAASTDQLTRLQIPSALLLRGSVKGGPSSHVMLAVFESWATGYISIERSGVKRRYLLSSLSKTPNSTHIVNEDIYSESPGPWDCGSIDTEFPARGNDKGQEQTQAVNKIVRIALEGDEEYYIDHGRDVYKCAEYAQAVLAAVSDIYQRDVSAAVMTPWMAFWTATDPYPGVNSGDILTQLRTYWQANRAAVSRSSAMLLSGVNGIGGVAYVDALCTNNGYAVSGTNNTYTYPVAGYVWDTDVCSHELGHNVGARHTHSCTWNPPIDSCVAAEGTCYTGTKAKLGTIMSYCHLTPFGTELLIHTRVSAYMVTRLAARTCVLAPGTMTVSAGPDTALCNGLGVVLNGSVSGGTAPYTYSWSPLIGITNPNSLTPTVTPTKNIKYVLEVRDNAGKVNTDTVKILVGPPLTVSAPSTISTCSESQVSITVTAANGDGAYQYTWLYDDITVHSSQPTLTFTPLFADTILVLTLVEDGTGLCAASDTTMVYVSRKPYVVLSGPEIACRGEVVVLNTAKSLGKAPYVSQWTVNGVPTVLADDNVQITVDASKNVRLIVTDSNNCADTALHVITMRDYTVNVTPTLVQLPPIPPCADTASARVVLTNTGTLPVIITQANVLVLNNGLPRTIAVGASAAFDVHLVNLPTGTFADTIKFSEGICNRVFKTVYKGQRNGVRITTPLPLSVGPLVSCVDSTAVEYSFVVSNGANAPITLNLPEGPMAVPALSDTTIRRGIRGVFPDGILADTLRIPYTSGACTGSVSVPFQVDARRFVLDRPDSVSFGIVTTDDAFPITRPFQLTATSTGIPFVVVDSVSLSPPFTTSIRKGQRLNNAAALSQSITFALPTTLDRTDFRDTLRIRFEDCGDEYEIPVSTSIAVTNLDSQFPLPDVNVQIREGVISVAVYDRSEISAELHDLNGRRIRDETAEGGLFIDTQSFDCGVYALRVKTRHRIISRLVLITH